MTERVSITELRDEFVICRTLGHSWDEHPGAEFSELELRVAAGALALRCTRCTTVRLDYIAKDMTVYYRKYTYPDQYTSIPGEGTRPNLRGEMFRRSLLIRTYKQEKKNARS